MNTINSSSPTVGGTGGTAFTFACPPGAYITQFAGRASSLIDGISAVCSDGTKSAWYGGQGGTAWTDTESNGFGAAIMQGITNVTSLRFARYPDIIWDSIHGTDSTFKPWLGCGVGSRMTGMTGRSSSVLDQLRLNCSSATNPTAPVSGPTGMGWLQPIVNAVPVVSPQLAPAPAPATTQTAPTSAPPSAQTAPATQGQPPQEAAGNQNVLILFLFFFVLIVAIAAVYIAWPVGRSG